MYILIILLVLLLGYQYATTVTYEKIKLKRSSGWEAYSYLAKHGTKFLFWGIFLSICIWLMLSFSLIIIEWVVSLFQRTIFLEEIKNTIYSLQYKEVNLPLIFLIIIVSKFVCEWHIQKDIEKDWLNMVKHEDSILNIVIEAIKIQSTVRVSLKSRKVYVGLIQSEQFERLDLDNIVLIPFLSGYRNKENLSINLIHNYTSVYFKNKLIPIESEFDEACAKKLDHFRVVIRVEEIESISLFDDTYFYDFS